MGKTIDITGNKIGDLTVISKEGLNKYNYAEWNCLCSCGKSIVRTSRQLKSKKLQSCGCKTTANSYKHGGGSTPEYAVFNTMHSRCYNINNEKYPIYGGRGIKVCDRWFRNFENFISDMGLRPSDDHSIDRQNNDGNYEPSNCRWATREQQMRNRSISKLTENDVIEIRKSNLSQRKIASKFGVSQTMIFYIKNNKQWELHQATSF